MYITCFMFFLSQITKQRAMCHKHFLLVDASGYGATGLGTCSVHIRQASVSET